MPSAVELAADYVRMVRSNGPQAMLNVAKCYDPKGYHDLSEITTGKTRAAATNTRICPSTPPPSQSEPSGSRLT